MSDKLNNVRFLNLSKTFLPFIMMAYNMINKKKQMNREEENQGQNPKSTNRGVNLMDGSTKFGMTVETQVCKKCFQINFTFSIVKKHWIPPKTPCVTYMSLECVLIQ